MRRSLHCHPNCSSQNSPEQGAELVHEQQPSSSPASSTSQSSDTRRQSFSHAAGEASAPAPQLLLTCKVAGGQPASSWLPFSQVPELEQPKCQARRGQAELQPSGEQAHVRATWAAKPPAILSRANTRPPRAHRQRYHCKPPRCHLASLHSEPGNLRPEREAGTAWWLGNSHTA